MNGAVVAAFETELIVTTGKSSVLNCLLDKPDLVRTVGTLISLLFSLLSNERIEQRWSSLYVCRHGIPLPWARFLQH